MAIKSPYFTSSHIMSFNSKKRKLDPVNIFDEGDLHNQTSGLFSAEVSSKTTRVNKSANSFQKVTNVGGSLSIYESQLHKLLKKAQQTSQFQSEKVEATLRKLKRIIEHIPSRDGVTVSFLRCNSFYALLRHERWIADVEGKGRHEIAIQHFDPVS